MVPFPIRNSQVLLLPQSNTHNLTFSHSQWKSMTLPLNLPTSPIRAVASYMTSHMEVLLGTQSHMTLGAPLEFWATLKEPVSLRSPCSGPCMAVAVGEASFHLALGKPRHLGTDPDQLSLPSGSPRHCREGQTKHPISCRKLPSLPHSPHRPPVNEDTGSLWTQYGMQGLFRIA